MPSPQPDLLLTHWLAYAGVLLFAAALLWRHDVWRMLVEADPTFLTVIILLIFCASTVWCGMRAARLDRERLQFERWRAATGQAPAAPAEPGWIDAYLRMLLRREGGADAGASQLTDVLAERLHGPNESAWWVNGIQIKLGLLGKVIGFSILALEIARIESFDPSQTQNLLKSLTGGLGIALLTTAVGLVANILLGLQLVRLDRGADSLLADTLEFAEGQVSRLAGRSA